MTVFELVFITAEKGGVARAKGERKRRSVLQSARADGDGMRRPPGHFITGAEGGGVEKGRRGGGEKFNTAEKGRSSEC